MTSDRERNLAGSLADVWRAMVARPALSSVALGLIAALGYPPIHAWYLTIPALAAFVALVHMAPDWRAAIWRGWLFGWAHLTLANNWIATAFTYQAKMPEFLGWLAVPLLCIYLAFYPALAVLVAHSVARRANALAFGAVLAGAWIITEWMRGWVFTGYPWPPVGLTLLGDWDTPGFARVLPWTGTYALSGLTILVSAIYAWAIIEKRKWVGVASLAPVVLLMFLPSFGGAQSTKIKYRLVQPLIGQDEINDASKFEEQFLRIARLTGAEEGEGRLILWPESAIPDFLEDGYPQRYYARTTMGADPALARRQIGYVVGPESTLLAGVVNLDIGLENGRRTAVSARNSVIAMNGAGELTHHYAKAHLVPYGEYLPMRPILEPLGLSRLVAGSIDYLPGPGPRTLDLGEYGRAGIQICYEIVFSGQVVDRTNRPDYIFNPSNDGWFGWWGPPQHLAQARMRAIEEGLPVLRSTTTGISAVVDARGIVRQHVATGRADALDGFVPAAHPPTLFAQLGNSLAIGWAVILLALGLILPRLLASRDPRS